MKKGKLFGNRGWHHRSASAAAALTAAALAVAALGTTTTAASAAPAKYNFVLIPGTVTDPFYITMGIGAKAEAAKLGISLTFKGTTTWNPTQQVPIVNATLATHPSALLIAPSDDVALFKPIDAYVKADIPVVSVDTTLADTSILTTEISSDNYQGGEAAAETIAARAHDTGAVAIVAPAKGVTTDDLRVSGFLAQMKKYPNMTVVGPEYSQNSPTTAEADARALILAHKNLVGIFGTDLYDAEGVGKGVDASGMKGKISIAGYDAEPVEITLLKQGVIDILVAQDPALEGELGVQYAYDALTGHKSLIPTKEVLLPNVVITTQDVNNPNVAKYIYKTTF